MLSDDIVEVEPSVVAGPTAKNEFKQQHVAFNQSELLRKLGARKAAWRRDVTFDLDRLLDSGAVLPASDIDLVVEEDETQGQDDTMPSSLPVDGDNGNTSDGARQSAEDAAKSAENASQPPNEHTELITQCEATDIAAPADMTAQMSACDADQPPHLQSDAPTRAEEAGVCQTPQTDAGAKDTADGRSGPQDTGHICDEEAVPVGAHLDSPEDVEDMGHTEQELAQQASGDDVDKEQSEDPVSSTAQSDQEDEDEEEEIGSQMEDDDEDIVEMEDPDEDLQDEDPEEEGPSEHAAEEGTAQVPEEDDEADEMEEQFDEDDEEAELLAAIQRERKMQVQLKEHNADAAPFCDGEAEQSEDEAVSSDEDMEDDDAVMSVEEITEMVKELREKGTGQEELAAAHARWLEEQDSDMLKRLMRDVKRGFGKGRKRVQDDGDDWDQEDARMRRKQVVGQNGLAAADLVDASQMTTAQIMRQYKRKLAAIGASEDNPKTPVRRTRPAARAVPALEADENEDANLPMIPDSGSPRVKGIGRMKQEAIRDVPAQFKGPTLLLGKRKKHVETIKSHSVGLLPCMLGMQEDTTARNHSCHL